MPYPIFNTRQKKIPVTIDLIFFLAETNLWTVFFVLHSMVMKIDSNTLMQLASFHFLIC